MWELFLEDNNNFITYGVEHGLGFLVWICIGATFFYLGRKRWNQKQQRDYITIFCVIVALSQLAKVCIRLKLGIFDHTNDLPLHLCNMFPFAMIFVMYFKSRYWWGILFFLIIGGTFQSLLTPTLRNSFPHYENLRYWIVHAGLTIIALYGVLVYKWKPTIRDALKSAIFLNIIAAIIYPINLLLDSNYLYLRAKPAGDTLYNFLGPWPWYILSLEGVLLIIFGIVLLPFLVIEKIKSSR